MCISLTVLQPIGVGWIRTVACTFCQKHAIFVLGKITFSVKLLINSISSTIHAQIMPKLSSLFSIWFNYSFVISTMATAADAVGLPVSEPFVQRSPRFRHCVQSFCSFLLTILFSPKFFFDNSFFNSFSGRRWCQRRLGSSVQKELSSVSLSAYGVHLRLRGGVQQQGSGYDLHSGATTFHPSDRPQTLHGSSCIQRSRLQHPSTMQPSPYFLSLVYTWGSKERCILLHAPPDSPMVQQPREPYQVWASQWYYQGGQEIWSTRRGLSISCQASCQAQRIRSCSSDSTVTTILWLPVQAPHGMSVATLPDW